MNKPHFNKIDQFYSYQWICQNFDMGAITIEIVDDSTLKITDINNNSALISHKRNKIYVTELNGKIIRICNTTRRYTKAKEYER
ncbi:hypothetical protein [Faecalibacillus intestinalis]